MIGPLDYFLVHRILKRPRLTWVTFPLLVFAATYLSIRSADERNGNELRLNQFGLIDVDATPTGTPEANGDGQRVHGQTWFTAYSPESMHYALRVRPAGLWAAGGHRGKQPHAAVCWSGITETVYGGMYRGGGLAMGQLTYTVQPETGAIERLPIPIWSTKTFKAEWRNSAPGLVDSRLKRDAEGRLTGTIRHRFAGKIEDWILVYGGMLYRPTVGSDGGGPSKSIPPNVELQISPTTAQQSGLMDHLTGVRFRKEGSDEDRLRTMRFEQVPYDSNGKDPLRLLQVMTFHRAVGGRKYTGLNDASVERLDLSDSLTLHRAVLVGRLRGPAANVALSPEADGKPKNVPPTRSDTFVRILLPVRR